MKQLPDRVDHGIERLAGTQDGVMRTMNKRSLSRGVLGGLLLAIPLLAAACTSPPPALDSLLGMPESELAYPGSVSLRESDSEAATTLAGTQPAIILRRYYVRGNAEEDAIVEFFERVLSVNDWDSVVYGAKQTSTFVIDKFSWRKDGIEFRLDLLGDEGDWGAPPGTAVVYETRLIGPRG